MEPVMKVEVTTPEDYMAGVIGDVNSRRGIVSELADRGNMKVVKAKVPLSEMFQYVSTLRSITKGRASYSMELDEYEMVPDAIGKELMTKFQPGNDDE
jgi:elongation factor G